MRRSSYKETQMSTRILLTLSLALTVSACGPSPDSTQSPPALDASLSALALGASGSLDPGYGAGGVALAFQGGPSNRLDGFGVQTDGKAFLLIGSALAGHNASHLTRLRANGQLDTAFGTNGSVNLTEQIGVLALYCPNGANVYNDWGADCEDPPRPELAVTASATGLLSVLRYLPSGQPDPSFGQNGTASISAIFGPLIAVVIQSDGKTLVADEGGRLIRVKRNGAPDPTFGNGGIVSTPLTPGEGFIRDMVLSEDERILLLINTFTYSAQTLSYTTTTRVTRLTNSGQPDPSYGTAGSATVDFDGANTGEGTALLPTQNGRLMVGGTGGLWRLLPGGSPDTSFGTAGHADFGSAANSGFDVTDLTQDRQERIVASVVTDKHTHPHFEGNLARILKNGKLDPSFGTGGVSHVNLCAVCTIGTAQFGGVAVLRSGRLLGLGTRGITRGLSTDVLAARMAP